MGADHIFIYSMEPGPTMTKVMQFYQTRGVLTVLQLPVFPANQSWYFGQTTAINDCHYRVRYNTKFILMHDMDEFVTPLKHVSYIDMIKSVEKIETAKGAKNIGGFMFQNGFYCKPMMNKTEYTVFRQALHLSDDDLKFVIDYEVTLIVEQHMLEFHDFPKRVKTIYLPDKIQYPGIHFPMKLYPNVTKVAVDSAIGFLAHHRRWDKKRCYFDLRILPYFKKYVDSLRQSYSQLQQL